MRSIETDGDASIDLAIEKALQTLQIGRDQVEVEHPGRRVTKAPLQIRRKEAARVRATVQSAARLPVFRAPRSVRRATIPGQPLLLAHRLPCTGFPREHVRRRVHPPGPGAMLEAVAAATVSDAFCRSVQGGARGADQPPSAFRARSRRAPGGRLRPARREERAMPRGLLIGRRGQTLDAIEYIVNRIAARDDEPAGGRIVIDVEQYRERRRDLPHHPGRAAGGESSPDGPSRDVELDEPPVNRRDRPSRAAGGWRVWRRGVRRGALPKDTDRPRRPITKVWSVSRDRWLIERLPAALA